VVGGGFTTAGGVSANCIARWNGTSWSALGSGTNYTVEALATLPNGDLVAGGQFTIAGGVSANRVARWNGTSWSALGSGISGPFSGTFVSDLVVLPNGDLVAGGDFTTAGGVNASRIARWDGTSWSALGSGLAITSSLERVPLVVLPNGDLVAGSYFAMAGGVSANSIARWNGTNWSALGSGMNSRVRSLTKLPNGDLVAGGEFTTAGGVNANRIARWNGTSWSALGSGMNNFVRVLTTLPNGDVLACGAFTVVNGAVSRFMAQLTTTCPATAVSYGAGCIGSAGANVLAATSLPWIGSTFRSVATGMPVPGLALGVVGFSTLSIPMSAILPQGVPGCTLLVSPDLLELYVPAAGIVQTQIVLPNTVALAGGVFHQQVVPIEFDGTGTITALTGTNALTQTIGSF
jgi:hypothetical protein